MTRIEIVQSFLNWIIEDTSYFIAEDQEGTLVPTGKSNHEILMEYLERTDLNGDPKKD